MQGGTDLQQIDRIDLNRNKFKPPVIAYPNSPSNLQENILNDSSRIVKYVRRID